jgi:hypothetical protein
MKVKSFLLLGLIVLICSLGVLSLMGRLENDQEYWRPADVYSALGGSQGSSYSAVSYGSGAYTGADALVVSSSRSMFRHHAAFSYAPAHSSPMTNSQYPIGGTPSYSSKGASALYTTSSATIKSFGGGGNGTAIMSSSSTKKSVAASAAPMAMTVAMPSTSVFAQNTRSVNAADAMPTISGDIAMASSYAGIGNTTGGRRISGRRNAGPEDQWLGWLGSDMWGYGGGSNQIVEDDLFRLWFKGMTGEEYDPSNPAHIDFMNSSMWDSFLAWFNSKQTDKDFGWYWLPISDAIPFLLLLCAVYVWVVYRRAKKQQPVE